MGVPRVIGAVVAPNTANWRTPVYTGPVTAAVSFFIKNGIAVINLGAGNLPTSGYNGPQLSLGTSGNGQQITLWGFTTATYFNGKTVTVLANGGADGWFSFAFAHADVATFAAPTADAGNTASAPVGHYRAVRLECAQGNSTNIVYVGDSTVDATHYMAALTLANQLSIVIASNNIPAERIWLFGSSATNCSVQVSLIY